MSVPAAYLTVVIIWSTTPLAIQWSSEGWGFMFGITGRMVLGALVCLALLIVMRRKLPLHRQALLVYASAGIGIYGAMMCVYWASQFIPSGLVAVIFGLSPIVTGIVAALILKEDSLTVGKMAGGAMGVMGLWIIFTANIHSDAIAWQGIVGMLSSVLLHALSAVLVKRVSQNESIDGFAVTAGGLLAVVPLYLLTWYFVDGSLPDAVEWRPSFALVYLGILGSVLGFSLYFYVLKRVETNKVALITLITPVTALLLGQFLNQESIPLSVWFGTAFILAALSLHQWGDNLFRSVRVRGVAKSGSVDY